MASDPSNARLPLIALLGHAHDALEAEFNRRLKQSRFGDLSLAHSRNVLRHVPPAGCRATSLAASCGVSKQALSLQITHLEQAGYLTCSPDPTDGRARILELTPRGCAAQDAVRGILGEIDQLWRDRWGAAEPEVRDRLAEVVGSRTPC